MRLEFEKHLAEQWMIYNPEMFELNEKGNYKIGAVDRAWAYYQLYEAVAELKRYLLKLFSNTLDKQK